jgi:hypothetical protein
MWLWFVLLPVSFVSFLTSYAQHHTRLAMANKAYGGGVELLNKILLLFFVRALTLPQIFISNGVVYKSLSSGIAELFITY